MVFYYSDFQMPYKMDTHIFVVIFLVLLSILSTQIIGCKTKIKDIPHVSMAKSSSNTSTAKSSTSPSYDQKDVRMEYIEWRYKIGKSQILKRFKNRS